MLVDHNEFLADLHIAERRIISDRQFSGGEHARRLEYMLAGINIARQVMKNIVHREKEKRHDHD